jgi:acetyl-CoA synthetase
MKPSWTPQDDLIKKSNIYQMMQKNGFVRYEDLWKWSVSHKEAFWEQTIENLNIRFHKPFKKILDSSEGPEKARWLTGAKLNIVDSCFQNEDKDVAVIYQQEGGAPVKVTQLALEKYVNRIANSIKKHG